MNAASLSLVLFSVTLTVIAQLLLKKGALALSESLTNKPGLTQLLSELITNYPLISGLAVYALSAVAWILALTKVNVSIAYPFVGLGIVGTTVAGYLIFGEKISSTTVFGIILVISGLFFIAKT